MAVTNIHSIKTNLSGAISYIINRDKTVNGLYVTSYLCRDDSRGAAEDFAKARQQGTGRTTILAHHIIQSFKTDEVTPEQALAVSEELCDKFLKGRYQYVLAIHTDHDHIHAHIIFNNINAYNGLSFTYEENQGTVSERSWAKLCEISDEICREHNLSVIDEPEKGMGISHYERDMQIEGKSWKEKLRHKLAKIIIKSGSFEDFLRRCDKKNIEVVYEPTHKYKIKYRLEGQQRFVRGETLGEFYTADAIEEQIKLISKATAEMERKTVAEPIVTVPKTEPVTAPKTEPTAAPSERGGVLYNALLEAMRKKGLSPTPTTAATEPTEVLSETEEVKADSWADLRGMKKAKEMIEELEKAGFTSADELYPLLWGATGDDNHSAEIMSLRDQILIIQELAEKIQRLDKLAPIYKEYRSKSGWAQKRYKSKNCDFIDEYEEVVAFIKAHKNPYMENGKLMTPKQLTEKAQDLINEYNALVDIHNAQATKISVANKYIKDIRNYLTKKTADRQNAKNRQLNISQQRKKNQLE